MARRLGVDCLGHGFELDALLFEIVQHGDEVAQVYYRHVKSALPQAQLALCGFARVNVPAGKTVPITIQVPVERFRYWDTTAKHYVVEPGAYEILAGGASDQLPVKCPLTVH